MEDKPLTLHPQFLIVIIIITATATTTTIIIIIMIIKIIIYMAYGSKPSSSGVQFPNKVKIQIIKTRSSKNTFKKKSLA